MHDHALGHFQVQAFRWNRILFERIFDVPDQIRKHPQTVEKQVSQPAAHLLSQATADPADAGEHPFLLDGDDHALQVPVPVRDEADDGTVQMFDGLDLQPGVGALPRSVEAVQTRQPNTRRRLYDVMDLDEFVERSKI